MALPVQEFIYWT